MVENNHYFPRDAIDEQYLKPSDPTSFCPWKGTASYYDISVGDERAANAAWYYPEPKEKAAEINVLEVRSFGSMGRVYLGGEERDIEVGWQAAVAALEGLTGRDPG